MSELIYRPGLEGVIAGETAISTIADGLRYRGYAIEDLARESSFEEVAYLLLYGELPNASQLDALKSRLSSSLSVPAELLDCLQRLPTDASLMDVLRTSISMLGHWDPDVDNNAHDANLRKAERLLAQIPVLLAAAYRHQQQQPVIPPASGVSIAENLLVMLGHSPTAGQVRAMDVSLILYAEHEFNASAFTARVIASTLSDLHSSIVGAIGALKGPLHGGANERVMEVLAEVGGPENAESWVRDALQRKVKVMGFGHRVYKTGDPRAEYLKTLCRELAAERGRTDLEQTADTIEAVIRAEKGLPPNLDWPSARLYHYLGLEVDLYTPLFVVSRVAGWSAHVIEQHDNNRIIRPRSNYTGPEARPWRALNDRQ